MKFIRMHSMFFWYIMQDTDITIQDPLLDACACALERGTA